MSLFSKLLLIEVKNLESQNLSISAPLKKYIDDLVFINRFPQKAYNEI